MLIQLRKCFSNRVLFGEKLHQKVHGSNAYLAAKFYFKRYTFWRKIWPKIIRFKCLFSCEILFQTVYFLAKILAKKYTVQMFIQLRNSISNGVLFGEKFGQKVYGSNAYLAAKFYFKPCTFWRNFSPKSTRFKFLCSCEILFQNVYFLAEFFAKKYTV